MPPMIEKLMGGYFFSGLAGFILYILFHGNNVILLFIVLAVIVIFGFPWNILFAIGYFPVMWLLNNVGLYHATLFEWLFAALISGVHINGMFLYTRNSIKSAEKQRITDTALINASDTEHDKGC